MFLPGVYTFAGSDCWQPLRTGELKTWDMEKIFVERLSTFVRAFRPDWAYSVGFWPLMQVKHCNNHEPMRVESSTRMRRVAPS